MTSLSGFRDSDILAIYFSALAYESNEEYENALQLLQKISLYNDGAERILTYPQKIQKRDYAIAEENETAGNLKEALDGFKKLGSYLDSELRVETVQNKLNEQAYQNQTSWI